MFSVSDIINAFGTFFQDMLNILEQLVNWLEGWLCGLLQPMAIAFINQLPDFTGLQSAWSAVSPYAAWVNEWIALDILLSGLAGFCVFFAIYFIVKLIVRLF